MARRIRLSPKKWTELKMYVYDRDKWCLNCGDPYSADAAHVVRRSQGGDDAPNNVIRLCRTCHSAYDEYKIELPGPVLEMLKSEPIKL